MERIRPENFKAYLDAQKGAATAIAKALNVSKGLVSHWKHGAEPVPESYTDTICHILGRSKDDLCKPMTGFRPALPDSAEMRMLAKVVPNLSDQGLNQVLLLALQLQQSEVKSVPDP